jgi:hypothetical protein
MWAAVDAVVDRAPGLGDLRAHGLHLLAARRWREQGREVPAELADEEFQAAWTFASARAILRDIRAAYDGKLIVLKGPHTATFYPAPQLRAFSDIDILADDPEQAHRALIAAGFILVGYEDDYYRGLHHLRPLADPQRRLAVEIHRFPNWFWWGEPPRSDELFAAAQPDVLGIDGLHGLSPEHHALVLAVHSWNDLPFRRLSDYAEVMAIAAHADRAATAEIARRWRVDRVWRVMSATAEAMFARGAEPLAMRIFAPNFPAVRDRTVQDTHLRRLLGDVWGGPPREAMLGFARAVARAFLPAPSETWATKLTRARLAMANRRLPAAEHSEMLGPLGRRAPRFRRR